MHNLHPGANLHPGFKFAPRVYFGHVNGVFRICTRCKFAPGCKFAPTFEVEQINLHPGANCAYERKMCIFYSFRSAILIYCRPFL